MNNIVKFIKRLDKFNLLISKWLMWAGIFFMMVIVIVTGVDVIGGKLFTWRLLGAIDIVQLSQVLAMGFGVALALIEGRHVNVEFVISKLPATAQRVVGVIVNLIGLLLFMLIVWRLLVFGYSFFTTKEATATIYIPVYPFIYALALACIPVCLIFLANLMKS
ncbi:MAG: hypothetical protein A2Z02_01140, partial [Chloroflexi bacterium RBG_16_48_7]